MRLRPRVWVVLASLWVACAAAACAACDKSGTELPAELGPRPPAVDVAKLTPPPLFSSIPADAPYAFATFEPVPLDYLAKLKRAAGPMMMRSLGDLSALDPANVPGRWLASIIEELDGKWNAKGLVSIGFSPTPRFAIYGIGALPVVMRFEIADGKAMLATLERIAHRAGFSLPALENRHGREFWRIPLAGETGAIVAILDKQLVAAFGPRARIADALPQIVAAEKPPANMGDGKLLKELIAKHQLGAALVGFIDTKRVLAALAAMSDTAPPKDCLAELESLAAMVPRVVLSYSELSSRRVSAATILELAPPAVAALKSMKAVVPGLGAALSGDPMLAMGGGIDLGRARGVAKALAGALVQLGDACEEEELIAGARKMQRGLAQPLPAGVDKLTGGAIAIQDLAFTTYRGASSPGVPEKLEGFAMVTATDAGAAFTALTEAEPSFGKLLAADGKLHELDRKQLGLPLEVHAGVGDATLVLGAGEGGRRLAAKALGYRGGAKAPFFVATVDYGKLLTLAAQLSEGDERAMNQALAKLFGRAVFSLDATDAGLAAWMSFELR